MARKPKAAKVEGADAQAEPEAQPAAPAPSGPQVRHGNMIGEMRGGRFVPMRAVED